MVKFKASMRPTTLHSAAIASLNWSGVTGSARRATFRGIAPIGLSELDARPSLGLEHVMHDLLDRPGWRFAVAGQLRLWGAKLVAGEAHLAAVGFESAEIGSEG
jgi:hypothetical protein